MTLSFRRTLAGLMPLALVAGCAVGPNYRHPGDAELKIPAAFRAPEPATIGEADLSRWWEAFGDPVLTGLVRRGLAANLDIAQAGARLRQARATLRQARADLFPTIDLSGSVSRTIGQGSRSTTFSTGTGVGDTGGTGSGSTIVTSGGDATIYRGSFDAAYEVDVFGGVRRSIEQARANAQSSEALLHDTQLSIAAEIALDYVSARLAQTQLQIASDTLKAQDETLEIVGWRVKAGLVSSLDFEQSRQLRAQTAASLTNYRTSYAAAVNGLAVLLGEAPGAVTAEIDPVHDVPIAPVALAAAIPADVIKRRPDVAAAERSAAAQVAGVGIAEAQLYPALRLSGSLGGSGVAVGDVVSTAIGSVVASLSAPIFQGGRLRAAVQAQRAAASAALDAYRLSVLTALEDVENAMTSLTNAEERERQLAIADDASNTALIYAQSQYRAGLIDFQTLLDSERSRLSTQNGRIAARADRATATIQLYKALGGGWESAPIPATASADAGAGPSERR